MRHQWQEGTSKYISLGSGDLANPDPHMEGGGGNSCLAYLHQMVTMLKILAGMWQIEPEFSEIFLVSLVGQLLK